MTQLYEWEPAESHNPWGKKRVKRTHCTKGHEFTEENTFVRAHDKARVCRECRKQYAREKYKRTKAANNGMPVPKKQKVKLIDFSEVFPMSGDAGIMWRQLQIGLANNRTPCMESDKFYSDELSPSVGVDQAEELCYGCPLLKICYDYAVTANESWGIWGGVNFTKEELVDTNRQQDQGTDS